MTKHPKTANSTGELTLSDKENLSAKNTNEKRNKI
jgi:hypothetical protein